jgi:thiol-disulfide isomerase/thioredoxin
MVRNCVYIFIGLCFFLYGCSEQEKAKGVISGKLDHGANRTIYLQRVTEHGDETIDSALADGSGKFSLPNKADELDYYLVRTAPAQVIYLVLSGDEQVSITGDALNLAATYDVKGSNDSKLVRELNRYETSLSDSLNKIYTGIMETTPQAKDSVGPILQAYYSTMMDEFSRNFIMQNMNSIVSLSASTFLNLEEDNGLMEKLETSLLQLYPNNKYVQEFKNKLDGVKALPAGTTAPEVKLQSPDGKEISLSSLRGKTVLIDFWASWCGPCRRAMPEVVALYKKFKNRNFEIYGISLDENVSAWKEAIAKDGITWIQVSDLKRWDGDAVKAFHVDAIPFTVLLDAEGKIVAHGIMGRELEEKIEQVLSKKS